MDKRKILVIDDEEHVLEIFMRVLKECCVSVAANEEEALNLLAKESYDLIFLDVVIPNTDTLGLLKTIKRYNPKVKVVMITGFAVEKIVKQALRLGAIGVMRKPFEHVDDINKAVERYTQSLAA